MFKCKTSFSEKAKEYPLTWDDVKRCLGVYVTDRSGGRLISFGNGQDVIFVNSNGITMCGDPTWPIRNYRKVDESVEVITSPN